MLAAVAARMGYLPYVLAPEERPPAAAFAAKHVRAEFGDEAALEAFAKEVDVVTFEFENVSSAALSRAAAVGLVRPCPEVLYVTQDRSREKRFLARHELPHVGNRLVSQADDLAGALREIGTPCVVKTAGFGYDGKGQRLITAATDVEAISAATAMAAQAPVVVERFIDLRVELSVIGARTAAGEVSVYAPIVNRHVDHILDISVTPAVDDAAQQDTTMGFSLALTSSVVDEARELTIDVMRHLDLVGLCCVEFFLSSAGELLINEIAPRPHNSGHLTIEAAATSQFEQQLRTVTGLTLGAVDLKSAAATANLLGDLWRPATADQGLSSAVPPDFARALEVSNVSLHLYGKTVARPGRKMGHLTALGGSPDEAVERVINARNALSKARSAVDVAG